VLLLRPSILVIYGICSTPFSRLFGLALDVRADTIVLSYQGQYYRTSSRSSTAYGIVRDANFYTRIFVVIVAIVLQ
jgi:hypothetical protein